MTEDAARPRRWALIVLAAVGVAALAFAIGRFTMFGNAAPTPNAADAGFARDMQTHHAQAVDMAMTIHRGTEDEQIRALAYDIATGQAAQRGEMFDWLVQWGLPQTGDTMAWMSGPDGHDHAGGAEEQDVLGAMGMANAAELAQLDAATGTAADCLFLDLMIRHHAGALTMTEAVLERGSVPRVLQVAQTMQTNQGAEIDAMESIRERLGCTG